MPPPVSRSLAVLRRRRRLLWCRSVSSPWIPGLARDARAGCAGSRQRPAGGVDAEEIDHNRHRQRGDTYPADDQDPRTVVDDCRVPGALQLTGEDPAARKGHDHADRAGDRARDGRRPEDADRYELLALELLRILRADDQHVDEEEDHRQAPDHGYRRLERD